MRRRDFIGGTALTVAAAWTSPPAAGDAAAREALVRADYDIFHCQRDEPKYRALLTDDYLLRENGKTYGADGDVATMPKPGADYHRADPFEFKKVRVAGERRRAARG
jgi:hypothetical protein